MMRYGESPAIGVLRGLAILVSAAALSSCDNTLDPFVDAGETRPYYVYGFLETDADTQFVRVEPIRRAFGDERDPAPSVVTRRTRDGHVDVWRDSVVTLDDGSIGSLFYALFLPVPGETYELIVTRADGAETTAHTLVPSAPDVVVDTVRVFTSDVLQTVNWSGVSERPAEASLTFLLGLATDTVPQAVTLPYDAYARSIEGGWAYEIDLLRDGEIALQLFQAEGQNVGLFGLSMEIVVLSEAWAEETDLVDNGDGFFGSVARFVETWQLPAHVAARIGVENRELHPQTTFIGAANYTLH